MWVTVGAAARNLGISENAVRNRIKRGTLGAERRQGRVSVWVEGVGRLSEAAAGQLSDQYRGRAPSEARELEAAARRALGDYDELAEAWARDLRRQIGRLERQIDELHVELRAERARAERLADNHSEDMRRMATLLQAAQQQIGDLTRHAALLGPSAVAMEEARSSGRAEMRAEIKPLLSMILETLRRRKRVSA